MSLFLSIYLACAFLFILFPLFFRGAVKTVLMVLFLPAVPFLLAYRIRKEKPVMSALIYALWGSFYVLVTLVLLLDALTA
jgi:hypothetical protein